MENHQYLTLQKCKQNINTHISLKKDKIMNCSPLLPTIYKYLSELIRKSGPV